MEEKNGSLCCIPSIQEKSHEERTVSPSPRLKQRHTGSLSMIVGYQRYSSTDGNRSIASIYIYTRLKARISQSHPLRIPGSILFLYSWRLKRVVAGTRSDFFHFGILGVRWENMGGEGGGGRSIPLELKRKVDGLVGDFSPDGNKITSLLALERPAFPFFFRAAV